MKRNPVYLILLPFFVILLLVGIPGWYDLLLKGHRSVGYGQIISWGLWVAFYIHLLAVCAGAYLFSSLYYVFGVERFRRAGRVALWLSLISIIGGLLSIWADMGHMERFWKVMFNPHFSSVMVITAWLYMAFMVIVVLQIFFDMRGDLQRSPGSPEKDRQITRILGIIGLPVVFSFHGGEGALLGVMAARPYWNSALLPFMFLVSALATGMASLAFFLAFFSRDGNRTEENQDLVRRLTGYAMGFLGLYVLMEFTEIFINLYGSVYANVETFHQILSGPFWWVFWIVHLGFGVVLPAFIYLVGRRSVPALGLVSGLVATAFFAVKLNVVIPGMVNPAFETLLTGYKDPRYVAFYLPTLTEWLVITGILGLCGILFIVGYRFLPLFPRIKEEVAS